MNSRNYLFTNFPNSFWELGLSQRHRFAPNHLPRLNYHLIIHLLSSTQFSPHLRTFISKRVCLQFWNADTHHACFKIKHNIIK